MAKNRVVLIVFWSVVAVILTAILIIGITDKNLFSRWGISFVNSKYTYDNAERYRVGNDAVSVDGIEDIEINWINGSVTVKSYEGKTVMFEENRQENEDDRLRYMCGGKKLKVQFCKSGVYSNMNLRKDITVYVPCSDMNLNCIKISTVSADISMTDVEVEKTDTDTVSGRIELKDVTSEEIDADTVSGNINIRGFADRINGDTVSGNMEFWLKECPKKLDCDTTSGEVVVSIPENDGFTAKIDTVSGTLRSDFKETEIENKKIVYKNGSANFKFDSVSGSVVIKRAD